MADALSRRHTEDSACLTISSPVPTLLKNLILKICVKFYSRSITTLQWRDILVSNQLYLEFQPLFSGQEHIEMLNSLLKHVSLVRKISTSVVWTHNHLGNLWPSHQVCSLHRLTNIVFYFWPCLSFLCGSVSFAWYPKIHCFWLRSNLSLYFFSRSKVLPSDVSLAIILVSGSNICTLLSFDITLLSTQPSRWPPLKLYMAVLLLPCLTTLRDKSRSKIWTPLGKHLFNVDLRRSCPNDFWSFFCAPSHMRGRLWVGSSSIS